MHCVYTVKPNATSSNRVGVASLLGAQSRLPSAKGASRVDAIGSRPRRRFSPIEHDGRLDPREIQASSIDGTAANSPQQLAPGLLAEANAQPRDTVRSLQQNALPVDAVAPGPQHGPGTTKGRGAARLPARLVLLAADNAASLPSQLLRQLVQGIQRAAAEGRDIRLPREAVERLLRELRTRKQLSVQHGVPDEVWGGGSLTLGDPGLAATAATTSSAAGGPAAGDAAVGSELGGGSAYPVEESPADVQPQLLRPRGRRRQLVSADTAVTPQAQTGRSGAAVPAAAPAATAAGLRGSAGPPAPELQAQLLAHQEQLLQRQLMHGGGDSNGSHVPPSPMARGRGSLAGSLPGPTTAVANVGNGRVGTGAVRGSEGSSWSFMEDLHEAVRRGGHGQLPPEEALAALEACAAVRALPLRPVYDELLRAVRWAAVTAAAARRAAEAEAAAEAEGRRRERIGGVWLGGPVEEAARAVEGDRLGPRWAEQGRQRQHSQVAGTEDHGSRELQVAGPTSGTAAAAAAAAATAAGSAAVAAGDAAPAAAAVAPRDQQAAQQLPVAHSRSEHAFAAVLAVPAAGEGPGTALQPRPVSRRALQPPEPDPGDPPASSSHAPTLRAAPSAAPAAPSNHASPGPARPPQRRESLSFGAATHTSRPLPPWHPRTAPPHDPVNRQPPPYLLPPTRLVSVLCGLTRLGQRLSQPLWHDLLSYLQPALSFVNSHARHPRPAGPGALAYPPPLPLSHYDLVDLASALASAGCNPSTSLLAAHAAACHGWARHLSGRQAARLLLSYSSLDYLPPKPLVGVLAATVRTQLQWLDKQHVAAAAQGLVLMAAAMGLAHVHASSSGAEGGVESGGLEDAGNGAAGSGSSGGSGSRAGGSTAVRYLLAAAAECVARHAQLCAEERAALEQQQQQQQHEEELGPSTPAGVGLTVASIGGMGGGGGGGSGGGMAELLPLDDLQAWLPDASLFLRPSGDGQGQGQPASPGVHGTGPAAGSPSSVANGSGVAASMGCAAQRVEETEQQEALLGWLAAAVPLPCGSSPSVPEGAPQPDSPPSSPVLRLALAAGTDGSTSSTSSSTSTTIALPLSGATAGSATHGPTPEAWRRLPMLPPGLAPNGLAAACRLVLALGPEAESEDDSARGPLLSVAWASELLSLAAAHAAELLPSDLVPVVQVTCRVYGMYPELLQAAGTQQMESRQAERPSRAGSSSACSSDGGSGPRSGAVHAGDTLLQLLTAAGACVEQLSYGQVVGLRECVGLLATDPRVAHWLHQFEHLEVWTEVAGGTEAEGGRGGLGGGQLLQGAPAAAPSSHRSNARSTAGSAVTMGVAFGTFTPDSELLREVAEALLDRDGVCSRGGGAHPRAVRPEDVPPEPPPGGLVLGAQRVSSQRQLHQQPQGGRGHDAPEEDPRRWLNRLLRAHGERLNREGGRDVSSAAGDAATPELLPPPRRPSNATTNGAPVAVVQPSLIHPIPHLAQRPAVPLAPPTPPAAAPALRALIHVLHCCTEARVSLPPQQLQAMRLTWQRLLNLGPQQQPPALLATPAQADADNANEGMQRAARLSTGAPAAPWIGSSRQPTAPCDPALCVELMLAVAAAAPRGGVERAAAVLELAAVLGGAWAAMPPQLLIACLQVVAPAALGVLPARPPPSRTAPERQAAEAANPTPADTPAAASLTAVRALVPLLRELHRRVATEPWQLPPPCLQPLLRMLSQLSYRPWLPRALARWEAALTAEFVSLAAAAPGGNAAAASMTDCSIRAAVGAAVRRAAEQLPMPSSLAAVQYGIWVIQHFGVRVEKGTLRRLSAAAGACMRLMHPKAAVHLLQVCMSYGVAPLPRVMRATWEHVRYHWRRMGVLQLCGVVWSAARLGLRVPRDVQMAACLVAVTSVQQQQEQQQQAEEGMGSQAHGELGSGTGPIASGSNSSGRPSSAVADKASACSPADIVRLLWAVAYDNRCQPPANHLTVMCDALAESWRALRPSERAAALWALARMDSGQVVVSSRLSHVVLSLRADNNSLQLSASAAASLHTARQQDAVQQHAASELQGQPGRVASPAGDPRVGGEPPGDLVRECWAVAKLRLPVPPRLAARLLAELRAAAAARFPYGTGDGSSSNSGSTPTARTSSATPEPPSPAHQPHPAQPPALDLKESVQALYAATRLYGELRKQVRQERRARQAAGSSPPQQPDTRPQAPQAAPTARPSGASGASSNAAGAEHSSAEAVLQVLYDKYNGSAGLLEPLFAAVLATDPRGGAVQGGQGARLQGPASDAAAASIARSQHPLDIRTLADGLGALSRFRNDLAAHRQHCRQVQPRLQGQPQRGALSRQEPAARSKGTSDSAAAQSDGSVEHASAHPDLGPDPWVVSALARAEELLQFSAARGLGDRPAPAWAVIEVLQAASYMGAPLSGGLLADAATMLQMHLPYMGPQQLAGLVCLAGLHDVALPVELVAAAVRRLAGGGKGDEAAWGQGSGQEEQRLQYEVGDLRGCAVELEADELARVVFAAVNVLGGSSSGIGSRAQGATTGAGEALGGQHGSGDAGAASMAPEELALCVSRLVCGTHSRTTTAIGKPTALNSTSTTSTIAGRRSRGSAPLQVRLDPRLAAMTFDQLSMVTHGTVAAGAVPERRWLAAVVGLAGARGRLSDASGHGLVRMAEALEAAGHWPGMEWMDAVMDQAMQLRRCHVMPRDVLLRLKASLSRLRTLPAATRPFVPGAAPAASTTATAALTEANSSVPASPVASNISVFTTAPPATDPRHSARVSTAASDAAGTEAPRTDDIPSATHQTSPTQPSLLPQSTLASLIPSYAACATSLQSYSGGALQPGAPLPTPLPELLEAEAQRALGLAAELHRAFAAAALALTRLAAAHCGATAPRQDQQHGGTAGACVAVPSTTGSAVSARGRSVTHGSALGPLLLLSQLAVVRVDRVLALALKVAVLRSAHVLHSLRLRQPRGGQRQQYLTDTARPLALGEQLRVSGREHAGLLQLGLGGRGGAGPLVLWRGEERGRQQEAAVEEVGMVSGSDSSSHGRGESVVALARCGTPEVAGWRSMAAYLQGQGTGAEAQPVGMGSAVGRGRGAMGARRGPGSVQALAGGEAEMGLMVCLLHAKYVGALAQAFSDRG